MITLFIAFAQLLQSGAVNGQPLTWKDSGLSPGPPFVYAATVYGKGFTFGAITSVSIQHNLNSRTVQTYVYDVGGVLMRPKNVTIVDANTVLVTFDVPRTGRIVIK